MAREPSISSELAKTRKRAEDIARSRSHEYMTIEHLLLSLTDDRDAVRVFEACDVDVSDLKDVLTRYVDVELKPLEIGGSESPKPTAGFDRIFARAKIHVQSSGREEISGANVLVAVFSERESHAVYFLTERDMSRYDAVNFIVHGVRKRANIAPQVEELAPRRTPSPGEPKAARGSPAPSAERATGPTLFISYAWGDAITAEGRAQEKVVDDICAAAKKRGLNIIRDRETLSVGDSISEFMKKIGAGDRIFVILSEKYLKSPNCMFELSEIWRNSGHEGREFLDRVRIFALPDAKLWRPIDCVNWAIYWKGAYEELEASARQHGIAILGEYGLKHLLIMQRFYLQVSDILGTMSDIIIPATLEELEKYGLDDIKKS